MYEVRFHGRGGQGAVMASAMLAAALVAEGKYAVSIPAFGFERRGAPVVSFLRCSDKIIRQLTNIYNPDCIICVDPTLTRSVNIFAGIKPGGTLVQATHKSLEDTVVADTVGTVGLCNAVEIALEIFKRPITNTLMLGAFARTTGVVSLAALKTALEESEFRDAASRRICWRWNAATTRRSSIPLGRRWQHPPRGFLPPFLRKGSGHEHEHERSAQKLSALQSEKQQRTGRPLSGRHGGQPDAARRLAQHASGGRPRQVRQVRGLLALLPGTVR